MHPNDIAKITGLIVLSIIMALLSSHKAKAQEYRWVQVRHCDRTYGYCNLVWRYQRVHYYAPRYRRDEDEGWERRDERLEHGVHCKDEVVRVVGGEHATMDAAKNAATRQWQSAVRYDHGEKFMDLDNARGMRWRCDRSSTNESIAGRVGEAVGGALSSGGGFLKRCVISARPCLVGTHRDGEER
jgi:hypothetical protein